MTVRRLLAITQAVLRNDWASYSSLKRGGDWVVPHSEASWKAGYMAALMDVHGGGLIATTEDTRREQAGWAWREYGHTTALEGSHTTGEGQA